MLLSDMGVEIGGGGDGGDASPAVKNLEGDVPSRFENKMAQSRCFFPIFRMFWG